MGRIFTVNLDLPTRMRRKITKNGNEYYYYDYGGCPRKWLALGDDFDVALRKVDELERKRKLEKTVLNYCI